LAQVERKRSISATHLIPPEAVDPQPEQSFETTCERGRRANPGLLVKDSTFVAHLARVVASSGRGAVTSVSELAIEDLFLACACMVQAPGAVIELGRRHGDTIRAAIARLVPGPDGAEIEQQVLAGLMVGSAGSPPKIGTYAGKAPLDRWLQVTAQRAALTWLRARRADVRARKHVAAQPQSEATHPETAYLRERYRADFEAALQGALERLSQRDRALLRLHLVGGLTVESVGKMFGVPQTTTSRWLAKARRALLNDVKSTLHTRLGALSSEIDSLAGLLASDLDISLSRLLKTG
jgi:RNA polymerase sigma-70 factor (ECF subfamily)